MTMFSRRMFGRLLGATAGAAVLPVAGLESGFAQAPGNTAGNVAAGRAFPPDFLWGTATASYQVEGAVKEAGRGPSIWDTFSHTPGKVNLGDTGDVADDHFHRYKEDIALMKDLGVKGYRFSVSWSRIFPTGRGPLNPQGFDFYERMLDVLLAAGIQPYCTLFHWDLPQTLEDRGGWQSKDTSKAFGEYAGVVAKRLSDRVKHFMTINELRTFTELGYREGVHAPGLKVDKARFAQVCHNAILAHGLGAEAIRANAKSGTKVGLADNASVMVPAIETAEHIEAAGKALREENAMFLTAIQEGRYTDLYLKRLGAAAPRTTPDEMLTIGTPLDFLGINVYNASYVLANNSEQGYRIVQAPKSYPHMESPWLTISPEGLYWLPKLVAKLWGVKEIYVTENGASSADVVGPDGEINDTDRVMFVRNYLTQLQRAVAEGVPVKGYFLWSMMDNFEWADGYAKRFGIHYVDFATQKRTPKLSAKFYKEVILAGRVL